jgi:hypothetical protein
LCLLHICRNIYDITYLQAAALITHVLEYVLPLLPQTGMYIIGHALRQFGSAAKPTAEGK